jgi:hypothetical protein
MGLAEHDGNHPPESSPMSNVRAFSAAVTALLAGCPIYTDDGDPRPDPTLCRSDADARQVPARPTARASRQ